MKKLLMIIATLALSLSISSCFLTSPAQNQKDESEGSGNEKAPEDGNTEDGESTAPETQIPKNTIFGFGVYPTVIYNATASKDTVTEPKVNELLHSMFALNPSLSNDGATEKEHEMVIGSTSRKISSEAMAVLCELVEKDAEKLEADGTKKDDITGYAIYSNGSSCAVVWLDFQIAPLAIDYFKNNHTRGRELTLEPGVVHYELFSLSEYLKTRAEMLLEEKWAEFAKAIPEEYRDGIVREMKKLYDMYDENMVIWLANLYDPGVGGWYHSNSARDDLSGFSIGTKTVQYLPDIENTYVALTFMAATGMAEMFGGDWARAMPEWLLYDVGSWVQSLQDPDGFFYHPQWPKEYIVAGNRQSRITRDRGSAKTLLKKTGFTVLYTSASPSGNSLTDRLGGSAVAAVSKVVPTADMLWQYESNENFAEYLAGFDAELATMTDAQRAYRFYYYGNLFQSTTGYMTPEMKKMTVDFFNKHQNPENGMWSEELYYDSTNGIHKIGAVFNNIGAELRYIDKIVESTMAIINFDFETKPAAGGVNIYNAWSCFPYIYTNIRKCAPGTAAEREAWCNEIKMQVFAMAEDAIHNTFVHTEGMKQADGSFGYSRSGSSASAQGCPAAVPGSKEGDVNGNALTSYDIVHYITLALELDAYEIPMFTEYDRHIFVSIIEENREKHYMEKGEDTTYTLEGSTALPEELKVSIDKNRNEIPGSEIKVIKQENGNHAISFAMKNRGADTNGRNFNLTAPATALNDYSAASKLSFSIMIDGSTPDGANICEITICRASDGSCVILPKLGVSGGVVSIYDTAGKKITDIGRVDEFIDLEIVYRFAEKTYDVYVDGVFKGSSSATYGSSKHALPGKVIIGTASTVVANYLIDDIRFVNYK